MSSWRGFPKKKAQKREGVSQNMEKFKTRKRKKKMVIYTADFMQRIPEGVILSVDYCNIEVISTDTPQHYHNLSILPPIIYKTPERAQEIMQQIYEADLRGERVFVIPEE